MSLKSIIHQAAKEVKFQGLCNVKVAGDWFLDFSWQKANGFYDKRA
jgi:hypothetical protein